MPDPKATVTAPAAETPVPAKPGTAEEKKSIPLPNVPAPPKAEILPQATGSKNPELPLAAKQAVSTNSPVVSKPPPVTQDQKKPLGLPKDEKNPGESPKQAPTEEGPKPTKPLKPEKKPEPPAVSSQTAFSLESKNSLEKQRAEDVKDVKKAAVPPKSTPTMESKKPVNIPKEEKTTAQAAPVSENKNSSEKKTQEPAKSTAAPTGGDKKPAAPEKVADTAPAPPKMEAEKNSPTPPTPTGVRITQIFADRLDKPDEKALNDLPIPKEGEGFSIRLHPDYLFDFLDHPFSVNREVQDYKDLFDSIKATGINEPVKARPREGGGLELISGHRRHDIAKQLGYPVPVIIVQEDNDTAQIEVVDGNLHRQDIPTSELARAAKMKMDALARKAGRRSKLEQLSEPKKRTDQIVAEDMGMSRNQVNRLVRINSLVPELKQQVDDKTLPFNTAVELSFLKPEEQGKVVDFMKKEQVVPSMAQATALKEASRAAQEVQKALPQKPMEVNKPAPIKPPTPVDEKKIASIVKAKEPPEVKYTFTSGELKEYFPKDYLPTVSEVKRKVFDALDLQKRVKEREQKKSLSKQGVER